MTDEIDYEKFYYIFGNNNIYIKADLFRKRKDYTDLLTHIIKINNGYIEKPECFGLGVKFLKLTRAINQSQLLMLYQLLFLL